MIQDFERQVWLSSVPLVSVNDKHEPTGLASGCFIKYGGKRLLLSVQHATGNGASWAIQQRYLPNKGAELYRLAGINFLAKGNLSTGQLSDVDFSYVEIPDTVFAKRQQINPETLQIVDEQPISFFSPSLDEMPITETIYGFSGLVKPSIERHPNLTVLATEPKVYTGLRYIRTEDDLHYFSLPFKHPGHEHFKGCSGAPIIGQNGELVALVCGGCVQTNEVWGVSLQAYKLPINILIHGS